MLLTVFSLCVSFLSVSILWECKDIYITFLQGAVIADHRVSITPAVNYELPPEALALDSVNPKKIFPPFQINCRSKICFILSFF